MLLTVKSLLSWQTMDCIFYSFLGVGGAKYLQDYIYV